MFDDTSNEIGRLKDNNGRIAQENALLRNDIDKQMAEAYDLRKEIDFQQ